MNFLGEEVADSIYINPLLSIEFLAPYHCITRDASVMDAKRYNVQRNNDGVSYELNNNPNHSKQNRHSPLRFSKSIHSLACFHSNSAHPSANTIASMLEGHVTLPTHRTQALG